jgi:hypothetical protein
MVLVWLLIVFMPAAKGDQAADQKRPFPMLETAVSID